MKVRIARGTNPTIEFRVKGCSLSTGEDSFVTIRKDVDSTGAIELDDAELQIACNDEGRDTDWYGNEFIIDGDCAKLSLTREYTKLLSYDMYSLQFNLKDSEGNLFTHKPINIEVLRNTAEM